MRDGKVNPKVLDMVVWLRCDTCGDVTAVRVEDAQGKRPCPPLDYVTPAADGTLDVDAWLAQAGQATAVSATVDWTCGVCGDPHKTEIIGR